jgi:nucleoside phosphorylase
MGARNASASALALRERGVSALLCVGASGALEEELKVGDLFIAEWVASSGGNAAPIPCDPDWVQRAKAFATQSGFRMTAGGLVSVGRPAATPEEKARLKSGTGARAVDMESAAAAEQASGVPFLSIRVITDDARSSLPDLHAGWRTPGRLLAEGTHFLVRVPSMRRSLRRLQEFLGLLLNPSASGVPAAHGTD